MTFTGAPYAGTPGAGVPAGCAVVAFVACLYLPYYATGRSDATPAGGGPADGGRSATGRYAAPDDRVRA
ncbi:hypothetical protein AB0H63_16440 [Micromonospora echinospora]|uniref:hypothetical protein n=1 Tax=Micromonospora echinospora TaxID=1877 RepID=UPI0033EF6478